MDTGAALQASGRKTRAQKRTQTHERCLGILNEAGTENTVRLKANLCVCCLSSLHQDMRHERRSSL